MRTAFGLRRFIVGMALYWSTSLVCRAQPQKTFPDGKGKAEFERICSTCHDLETSTNAKRTKTEWAGVIDDMQTRGATGTDDEMNLIINYLAANFGKEEPKK